MPEHVVHSKGSCAHGTLTAAGEMGSADTARDPATGLRDSTML